MALVTSFSEETLNNFFNNNLKLQNKKTFKYLVYQCDQNENVLRLKVAQENEDFDMGHIMVKVTDNEELNKKKSEYATILENVFTIQDDNKEVYLGFAKKGMSCICRNNLENLKTFLKNLAEFQGKHLIQRKEKPTKTSEYKVTNVSDAVVWLEFFKGLDKNYVSDVISRLQTAVDGLFRDGLLVKSVGSIFANNVFITASDKCVFLDLGYETLKSPVYDVLIFIFAVSDAYFRQHHFKYLLSFYYQAFIEVVKEIDDTTASNFNKNVFEYHLKILLPIVKFETARYLSQKEKTAQEKRHFEELLNNILYSLKYPEVSYEDCLEAVSQKLGSTTFHLIDYQLVPVGEKNGHLGEYYNLKSKVNYLGKTEEFSMFTKILSTNNPQLNEFVQSGVSLKEQFFFRTLVPLFRQYGLESLLDFAPDCYFDRVNDIIIFDDLAVLDYKSFKPDSKVGYDVLKLAFLKIARFHACTLILEDRMSKSEGRTARLGDIYGEFMEDLIFRIREGLPRSPVNCIDSKPGVDQLIDSFEDVSRDISVEEFHKRVDSLYEIFYNRVNSPATQFRNVVCHGDFYASNNLIKYDQNGFAENCFIIDFQMVRYTPITADILMLVYFSTNKDIRDKYLDILLDEYYQQLKKILAEFGLDVNTFYTPAEFTECVKYMKPVAVIAAILYGQVTGIPAEKREEIFFDENKFKYYLVENRREFVKYLLSLSEDCKLYLRELIEDLYDICVNLK